MKQPNLIQIGVECFTINNVTWVNKGFIDFSSNIHLFLGINVHVRTKERRQIFVKRSKKNRNNIMVLHISKRKLARFSSLGNAPMALYEEGTQKYQGLHTLLQSLCDVFVNISTDLKVPFIIQTFLLSADVWCWLRSCPQSCKTRISGNLFLEGEYCRHLLQVPRDSLFGPGSTLMAKTRKAQSRL